MGLITRTNYGLVATHAIPDAVVKTLASIQLHIAENAAGAAPIPQFLSIGLNPHFADYANIDPAANFKLDIGGFPGSVCTLAAAFNVSAILTGIATARIFQTIAIVNSSQNMAHGVNKQIFLSLVNGGLGDVTGGDSRNVLNVSIFFSENVVGAPIGS